MINRNSASSDAFASTLRRTHEIPFLSGRYYELFYGKSQLLGCIDATQASPLSEEQFERYIYTDRFYDPFRRRHMEAEENSIYMDENMRQVFHKLIESKKFIIINNIPFTVHDGRKINQSDPMPCPVITNRKNKDTVKNFLSSHIKRQADDTVGRIAMAAYQQGASTITGSINSVLLEINRPRLMRAPEFIKEQQEAVLEQRKIRKVIMENAGATIKDEETLIRPFLQISLYRKRNYQEKEEADITIEAKGAITCEPEIAEWFFQQFQQLIRTATPDNELKLKKDISTSPQSPAKKESIRPRGENLNMVQVAICRQLPESQIHRIAGIFHKTIENFTLKYGSERQDEDKKEMEVQHQIQQTRRMFDITLVSRRATVPPPAPETVPPQESDDHKKPQH